MPSSQIMEIKGDHLVAFSKLKESEELFPILIRKLVYASAPSVQKVFFRDGKGTNLAGYDGEVDSSSGGLYVSQGYSVWELGASGLRAKADGDYNKRTAQPLHVNPKTTTFLSATLQRWEGKESWASERTKEGHWLSVLALDADDLASWIDGCPAVKAWLLGKMGRPSLAVMAVEQFVERWETKSLPKMPISSLLISRTSEQERVSGWIKSDPASLFIRGYDEDEGVAFFCASVMSLPETERERVLAKTLIFNDQQSLNFWTDSLGGSNYIFIRNFNAGNLSFLPVARGHHLLVSCHPQDKPRKEHSILLNKINLSDLAKNIEKVLKVENLEQLVLKSGGQLSILRRLLGPSIAPSWAIAEKAKELVSLLLVGGHCPRGKDYEKAYLVMKTSSSDVEALCKKWEHVFEPPIKLRVATYKWISRYDSWIWLSPFISSDQIKSFRELALVVLCENNPVLDMAKEDRLYAGLRNISPSWSSELKAQICETLCLVSIAPEGIDAFRDTDSSYFVDEIVREILKPHWRAWASLYRHLSLIAEASPEKFLDCLEASLSKADGVARLFSEEDTSGLGSSPHTGLLWALETLAWSPKYLSRASHLLLRLTQVDPGGKLVNRPANTLRDIFLSWLPHTEASTTERMTILKAAFPKYPNEVWRLLLVLIPSHYESTGHTASPKWRNWKHSDDDRKILKKDVQIYLKEIAEFIIKICGDEIKRVPGAIALMERLDINHQIILISHLENAQTNGIQDPLRTEIWDEIRETLNRTQSFGRNVLDAKVIEKLYKIYSDLTPSDVVQRALWLFSNNPTLPKGRTENWKEEEGETQSLRNEALRQIVATKEKDQLLKLVDESENSTAVAFSFYKIEESGTAQCLIENYEGLNAKRIAFFRSSFFAAFE